MIVREELVKTGRFNKPHGVKGEISATFTNDAFEESDNPFFICELDGIFVPFKVAEYRFTSGMSALVRLKHIQSEAKVRLLANKEIFMHKKQLPETENSFDYPEDFFIGFALIDEKNGKIGVISGVDTSTQNTLFIIEKNRDELFIPAADEWVTHIDEAGKKIYMQLPEGLLD